MSRLYLSSPCALLLPFAHGDAGAVGARLSLRPPEDGGPMRCKTRAKRSRGNENVCPQMSSPAKAGDPVFQRAAIDPRSRGVLGTPPPRGTTVGVTAPSAPSCPN